MEYCVQVCTFLAFVLLFHLHIRTKNVKTLEIKKHHFNLSYTLKLNNSAYQEKGSL